MWIYEKKLEFPVKITKPDARLAKIMIEQYGGADGELAASLRYLSQKFTMVTPEAKATLNDIATEEFAHLEMMGTIVHQLTQGLTKDEILAAGLDPYYVNHGLGVYPSSAAGVPFTAAYLQSRETPLPICMRIWQQRVRLHKHNLFLLFHSETNLSLPFCFFPKYEPFFFFLPKQSRSLPLRKLLPFFHNSSIQIGINVLY